MTIDWDLYTKRIHLNGSTIRERQKFYVTELISREFQNNPSYFEVKINNVNVGVQITDNTSNDSEKLDYVKKIVMQPTDTLTVGDIIIWQNKNWLCTSVEIINDIYYRGMMTQCNNTLSFLDKTQILMPLVTVPCVVSQGSSKQDESRFITLSADEYELIIPNTTINQQIRDGKRLLLALNGEINAFIVTSTNFLENVGLRILVIKKCEVNTNDNTSLLVADYYIDKPNISVTILNGVSVNLYSNGSTLQLNTEIKVNDVVVTDANIEYTSSNESVCTVSETGLITCLSTGVATISVKYNDVVATIVITGVASQSNNYTMAISPIDISIVLGTEKLFTATVLNNGVVDTTKTVTWSIISGSEYCSISTNNNTCILIGNTINKNIILRAIMTSNSAIYVDREITINSIL